MSWRNLNPLRTYRSVEGSQGSPKFKSKILFIWRTSLYWDTCSFKRWLQIKHSSSSHFISSQSIWHQGTQDHISLWTMHHPTIMKFGTLYLFRKISFCFYSQSLLYFSYALWPCSMFILYIWFHNSKVLDSVEKLWRKVGLKTARGFGFLPFDLNKFNKSLYGGLVSDLLLCSFSLDLLL